MEIRWPYFQRDPEAYKRFMADYYYFMIEGYKAPFGYVHSSFLNAMSWPDFWSVNHNQRLLTFNVSGGFDHRTAMMEKTLRQEHEKGQASAVGKWRDELFPIYSSEGEHVLDLDGCGVDRFGIVNPGVHLIGYVTTENERMFWIPRRSKTKATYPGMLDNTVGGSLASREKPIDCIVREAAEEALFPVEYTLANIKSCGTLSYQMAQMDNGKPGCQHQVQYLYEMEIGEDLVPKPGDGEVESFTLMSLEEVRMALSNGEFKLNCAMTWLAYLIRHGVINAENEENLVEICARLHRKHDLFRA
jgi:isopentenyldiphosphate isomerase